MCSSCGLYQAHLVRVDHFISIFFLPVLRVKTGTPFIECGRCGALSNETGGEVFPSTGSRTISRCPQCGESVDPEFHYCPFCGRLLTHSSPLGE